MIRKIKRLTTMFATIVVVMVGAAGIADADTAVNSPEPKTNSNNQPTAANAAAAAQTFTFDNDYWGFSQVLVTYYSPSKGVNTIDTGPLAVYMDRTYTLPEDVDGISVNIHLDGEEDASINKYFNFAGIETVTLHISGTIFGRSTWATRTLKSVYY